MVGIQIPNVERSRIFQWVLLFRGSLPVFTIIAISVEFAPLVLV